MSGFGTVGIGGVVDPAGLVGVGYAGVWLVGIGPVTIESGDVGVIVTGHIVVEIAIVEVTTSVESAGHEGTSGPQWVIVMMDVVKTVEVE